RQRCLPDRRRIADGERRPHRLCRHGARGRISTRTHDRDPGRPRATTARDCGRGWSFAHRVAGRAGNRLPPHPADDLRGSGNEISFRPRARTPFRDRGIRTAGVLSARPRDMHSVVADGVNSSQPMMPDEVTIESVALPGRTGAFRVTLRDGSIGAIRPAEQTGEAAWLALPGFANLHAHADRAYTVQSFRPRSLADAVAAAAAARALFTAADVAARATRLFERSVAYGVTRIRTHTDVDPVVEIRSMEGILAAKRQMGERLDVDVIAFSTSKNDLAEPHALDRLERAVAMGADLIGASLNASADPSRALESLFDLAEQSGLPVDLHLDEHLEPDHMLAGMVADAVIARGLQGR